MKEVVIKTDFKVDDKSAKTIQVIIDNANTQKEVEALFISLFEFDKVHNLASWDNVNDNLGIRIEHGNDLFKEIQHIVNGLIEENKRLKNIIENSNKGAKSCQS
jgi:hypothetical protein